MLKENLNQREVSIRPAFECFTELSLSLYWFIAELSKALHVQGYDKVFFLSREGQFLKKLFDLYQPRRGFCVESHYLLASRRSTLLPSLVNADGIEVLFRQYRNISFGEFFYSLGLEDYISEFAAELDLESDAWRRDENFPEGKTYARLKRLPSFQRLIAVESASRHEAFLQYLRDLSGGSIPSRIAVVDVGWKGSIQDNLHTILCKGDSPPMKAITGFYVGLVADGASSETNTKQGLLFSAAGKITPHFHVFNENRALYEILLAANHGSVKEYRCDSEGRGVTIHDKFEERDMLEQLVFPAQISIERHFIRLLESPQTSLTLDQVAKAHARMVFNPTSSELRWFSDVYHLENFGVRQRSSFAEKPRLKGILRKLAFLGSLLRRQNRGKLGFWPWKTLNETCGRLPAYIYASLRTLRR